MAASSIRRCATPRRGAIAFTIIRMAEKRSTLGDTAFHSRNCGRRRVAWNDLFALRGLRADGIAADLTALGALGKGIGSIDVAAPVPDIAAHVVKPVAVRGKGTDRRSSCESVRGVIAVWKSPVQRFSMKRPHGRSSLPPIRRKFPFCLRGKALLGPRIIGIRILPSDVDHRMIFTTRNAAAGAFGMRSPGTMLTYRANQAGHWLAENQRPGSQNLCRRFGRAGRDLLFHLFPIEIALGDEGQHPTKRNAPSVRISGSVFKAVNFNESVQGLERS